MLDGSNGKMLLQGDLHLELTGWDFKSKSLELKVYVGFVYYLLYTVHPKIHLIIYSLMMVQTIMTFSPPK